MFETRSTSKSKERLFVRLQLYYKLYKSDQVSDSALFEYFLLQARMEVEWKEKHGMVLDIDRLVLSILSVTSLGTPPTKARIAQL